MTARREIAVGLGAYAAYLLVRHRVWNDGGRLKAQRNAERVLAFEQRIHINRESAVQQWTSRIPRLVDVFNAGYAAGNVGLTVGWLIRLHHRGDTRYRRERNAALVAFVGSLPVFALLPTAPPRTMDGFIDTLATRGLRLDHPLLVRFYNPIAAMPSQHVAFAVVTGLGLAGRSRSPRRRALWRAYPLGVALAVVATGNHFASDVAAGAALGGIARTATR
jgi:membrane-associated phospholipid phosphatase